MSLNVQLLRQSFALVAEREPQVTKYFYEHLFNDYPAAKPLFADTPIERQQQMLLEALVAVVENLEDPDWLQNTLSALGEKHVGYGVEPHMYEWVGASLLKTLEQVAGDDWNDETSTAWGDAYGAIVSMMAPAA